MAKTEQNVTQPNAQEKPPVVVVMGHVDHGKTTLLDTIRKENVAAKEHGAITQHIGAYQVILAPSQKQAQDSKKITFIDTPGHEAFSAMRARGATVADIAILVVAADDSVKPQTQEAIQIIKEIGIPMIVAINKVDLPTANIDKVKKDLATNEVYVEGYGGDVVVAEISAKTGKGIPELLEMIGLVAEMEELKADPTVSARSIVIESRVDKGRGPVATIVVQQGTVISGKDYFVGQTKFRVRSLLNEFGQPLKEAVPATPCEVLGFADLPPVGSIVTDTPQEEKAVQVANKRTLFESLFNESTNEIGVILKADVSGSLEAIVSELEKVNAKEGLPAKLRILRVAAGDIAESDIVFAKSSKALVLGFNVRIVNQARTIAEIEGVPYKIYSLIYELLEDVTVLLETGAVIDKPKPKGEAQVLALFPNEEKLIAGVKVTEGRLRIGESVGVFRNGEHFATSKIKTMRHLKEDVREISKNMEAGIVLEPQVDLAIEDVVQYSP